MFSAIGVDRGQRQRVRGERQNQDRRVGGVHLADGRRIGDARREIGLAALIAASTSLGGAVDVAAEIELDGDLGDSRARSIEVSWVTPGIWVNCCSSGVATEDAIVCGSAPGNCAVTEWSDS